MIIIIPTIKYRSTYYNAFTMGVSSNYHGYFFPCPLPRAISPLSSYQEGEHSEKNKQKSRKHAMLLPYYKIFDLT